MNWWHRVDFQIHENASREYKSRSFPFTVLMSSFFEAFGYVFLSCLVTSFKEYLHMSVNTCAYIRIRYSCTNFRPVRFAYTYKISQVLFFSPIFFFNISNNPVYPAGLYLARKLSHSDKIRAYFIPECFSAL